MARLSRADGRPLMPRFGFEALHVVVLFSFAVAQPLYDLLGRARVVVSCARQETFGIVMQEGIALGAWALAPNRLSYPETIRGQGLLYDSLDQAADMLHALLSCSVSADWDGWHEHAIKRASCALRNL